MSLNVTELKGVENLPFYVAYFIGGTVIGMSNLVIFLAIVRYEALRTNKVYVLIMALSFADAINMSAYVIAGIRRTWLVFSGEHDLLYTPWQCVRVVHTIIWSFSVHMANIMLTVVSLDRLLCVMFPLRYIGYTYKYTLTMTSVAYVWSILTGIVGLVGTYRTKHDEPDLPARCIADQTLRRVNPCYSLYYSQGGIVWASVSVFIYVLVWLQHKRHNATVNPDDQQQQSDLEHERKFTKRLAMSCLCTFFLFILPYQFAVISDQMGYKQLPLILWTASNLNPFANVIIYLKRHTEIRQAIKAMIVCKTMPANITVWKANNMMAQMAQSTPKNQQARNNRQIGENLEVEEL